MSDIDSDAPAPDSRPAQQGARHESDHSGLDTDSVSTERNRLTATDAAPVSRQAVASKCRQLPVDN